MTPERELRKGVPIIYEFASVLFFGIVDDVSSLASDNTMKVTFYDASDPKVRSHLPAQIRLYDVPLLLRWSKLRLPDSAQWLRIKVAAA